MKFLLKYVIGLFITPCITHCLSSGDRDTSDCGTVSTCILFSITVLAIIDLVYVGANNVYDERNQSLCQSGK